MKSHSSVNVERLEKTLRYCPVCDPLATTPVATGETHCDKDHVLVVFTPWTRARLEGPASIPLWWEVTK